MKSTPLLIASTILVLVSCQRVAAQNDAQKNQTEIEGIDLEQPRIIVAADIDPLIENLAAGSPPIFRTRVFASGQLQDYPESSVSVERDGGQFDPRSRSLVVTGTMNGTPVIEDLRFFDHEGAFYVVRDVYVNGQPDDLRLGRATPVPMDEDGRRQHGESSIERFALSANATVASPAPQISLIHGYTDVAGVGILDGVVDMKPCGTQYDGGRAVNNEPSFFYWDLYGTNFGSSKGAIQLGSVPVPASSITQWTATYVRFYPTVPYNWGPVTTILSITTSAGGTSKTAVSIVPAIKTRIFGQCTWYVALTRLNAGKQPSPTAYPSGGGWNQISASYIPQLWDELVWEWSDSSGQHKHTAIITGVTKSTTIAGAWAVTITEANAACSNQITSLPSTFQVQNGTIVKAIHTKAVNLGPGWYYR